MKLKLKLKKKTEIEASQDVTDYIEEKQFQNCFNREYRKRINRLSTVKLFLIWKVKIVKQYAFIKFLLKIKVFST